MNAGADEHYFSAQPSGDFTPKGVSVRIAGKEMTVKTAGGVFSPDHVDAGTDALLRFVPEPPETGNLLDLGCGWGPLALALALKSPGATVWAVDVNERACELTRRNAESAGCSNVTACAPEHVPADTTFGTIWSNPPIRVGKAELHAMLEQWLPRLDAGGFAYLVVAKHLGADSLARWLTERFTETHVVNKVAQHKGFRIIEVESLRSTG